MNNIIVSFCIATYQRYEILKELILEILSVNSDKFDVVVNDNCSADGSLDKLKKIKDSRLKIYSNDANIGSLANMCEALNRGTGKYLFYINDRDNVDPFKIKKLITILEKLDKENVAFAKCINIFNSEKDYQSFRMGREALLEFGCRIAHPTGYIYRHDVWNMLKCRKLLFEKQCYGDYVFTQICAIMSTKYNGALIFGDICDTNRKRIDFGKLKSGYYDNRKDKRLWYTPEVQWREILIAYKFLKKLELDINLIDDLLELRYKEYLNRIVIEYKNIISKPENTIHYSLNISYRPFWSELKAINNGLYLWRRMVKFCIDNDKESLYRKINFDTKQILLLYLNMYRR